MKQYHNILEEVLNNGTIKKDRTGTGTISIPGQMMKFNLLDGFPLITTKKVHFKSIAHELLWFIKGDTNIKYLKENGVSIWNEWADENGNLNKVYGHQWRSWEAPNGEKIDQISKVIKQIKETPDSRRIIVSAWNVADIDSMALPPCHTLFHFLIEDATDADRQKYLYMRKKENEHFFGSDNSITIDDIPTKRMYCTLYQRSGDLFLGIPFNIASYSLLTHIMARVTNTIPYQFIHFINDAHIYSNHIEQVKTQLSRDEFLLPDLFINPNISNIDDFKYEDIILNNYVSHSTIKAPVAV